MAGSVADDGAPLTGRQLGSYQLGPLLAIGGMGEVYAAYDPRLKRDVAIKVVPAALASDPSRLQRLEREARAAAALNHPNILAVHDVGTADGIPYIVMERVPGETLAERLKRERIPIDTALHIGAQIADALAAVHEQGILHRDLKPANVMVMPNGRVKVLDFGLAKAWADDPTGQIPTDHTYSTSTGHVFGTPMYMAPEEISGRSGDPRADIYSLGVILFELVTGQRPFPAGDFMASALGKLTNPAPAPMTVEPTVPVDVSGLIGRCLEIDPDKRPASAADLRTALEHARTTMRPNTAWQVRRARLQTAVVSALPRRYRSAIAATAVAAALGLTAAYTFWPTAPLVALDGRSVVIVMPLENRTGDGNNDYLGIGFADVLTTGLSKLSTLSVVSREAVRAASPRDASAAALELGAQLLVQGTLQASGDRLRADLRLTQADGRVLWAGGAEAPLADLFALQRQLTERLVQALRAPATEQQQAQRSPTLNQEALEAYWRGMAYLEGGDPAAYDLAIASFERATTLDPAFAVAHARLGTAYVGKYNFTDDASWMTRAAAAATRALELDPEQTAVRLSLANVYRLTSRNGSAVEELRRVIADDPSNDEARRRLGAIFEREGRREEALEEYLAAVNLRPGYWVNHNLLGLFYFNDGRFEDAVRSFSQVVQLRPDLAAAFQRLGTAYQAMGENVLAAQNFQLAITLRPDAASYSNLGTLYYSDQRFAEAAQAYEQAIALRPDRALYRRNLGDAYLKLGRPAEARGQYEQAVQFSERALRVDPDNARETADLAVYLAKLGRGSDAARQITRALTLAPRDADVLWSRTVVLALAGNPTGAMAAARDAVANGYSIELARQDDDVAALRELQEFHALVAPRN